MASRTTTTRTAAPRPAGREIEGRDSVGLYLDEIARTPLLDAATEVELSKTIEAGLLAAKLLEERDAWQFVEMPTPETVVPAGLPAGVRA